MPESYIVQVIKGVSVMLSDPWIQTVIGFLIGLTAFNIVLRIVRFTIGADAPHDIPRTNIVTMEAPEYEPRYHGQEPVDENPKRNKCPYCGGNPGRRPSCRNCGAPNFWMDTNGD